MAIIDLFSRTPSPEKFAQLLMTAAQKGGVSKPMQFDADDFRILVGGADQVVNLHNLYREYVTAPKHERDALLAKCVSLFVTEEVPSSFEDVKDRLMPLVRARGYCEYLRLAQLEKSEASPFTVFEPFSSDAVLMLAIDSEQSMSMVTTDNLREWGMSFDEVMTTAKDNLRDVTVDSFAEIIPGVFVSDWNDAYDSSRILLPDLAFRMFAAPVAMVPTRGRLLLTSRHNPTGMLSMIDLALQCAEEEERTVSAVMYGFGEHGPVEFAPEEPVVMAKLESLRRQYLLEDYGMQSKLLDRIHEQQDVDIFVATYMLIENSRMGEQYSLSTWAKDVDTLLPRTDRIVLGALGEEPRIEVRWDDLVRIAGELMVLQPEAYPDRYRVEQFPSDEQLRALKQCAVGLN
jgi:uncharacterized protein YtpQ (UPF0354 family)